MKRDELKEIIKRVIERVQQEQQAQAPKAACIFMDSHCDVTTLYAVGEEG